METKAEGLVLALQGVMAGWLAGREQRKAEQRRKALQPISFPMAATAVEEGGGATACC
jgi:hypothetical protein